MPHYTSVCVSIKLGTQVCKHKRRVAEFLSLVSVYKYKIYFLRICYNCGKVVASRWFRNRQKSRVMYKRRRRRDYDDCISSRLLMVASLSPRFASSTDLITSTSMSGNISCIAATSSSVIGCAAAGCGCGGLPAFAGTAEHTSAHRFMANFQMKLFS